MTRIHVDTQPGEDTGAQTGPGWVKDGTGADEVRAAVVLGYGLRWVEAELPS